MLQEANSLGLDERLDHVGEDGSDSVEALVRLTDILQSEVVEEDLLDDEDGNRLGQLRASLHDTQTQRDYLR